MPTTIDIRELASRFDEILSLANAGGEVVLLDGTTPRARLVPYSTTKERVAGLHAGVIQTTLDFDAPLPDDFWSGRS